MQWKTEIMRQFLHSRCHKPLSALCDVSYSFGLRTLQCRVEKDENDITNISQQANISWSLEQNINCSCHCKNKQGHCLHFIAIFL